MSLLRHVMPEKVVEAPFPHLVIEDALDPQVCRELLRTFPPLERFRAAGPLGSNVKRHILAPQALADPQLPNVWRQLLEAHLQPEFLRDVVRIFGPSIRRFYPDFDQRFGRLETLRVGRRGQGDFRNFDLRLDTPITIHSPVVGSPSLERGPHLKLRHKLFFGHLLLRDESDRTPGGDYELYSIVPGVVPEFGPRQVIDAAHVRRERLIPYRAGTLFFGINTPWAIQNSSLRWPGAHPLQYLVIHGDVREPLFDIPLRADARPPVLRRWSRGVRKWIKRRARMCLSR